jgi:hypothetical protein
VNVDIKKTEIEDVWMKNIPKDYHENYLINEDCLKMAMCYHMRRKMANLLIENLKYINTRTPSST